MKIFSLACAVLVLSSASAFTFRLVRHNFNHCVPKVDQTTVFPYGRVSCAASGEADEPVEVFDSEGSFTWKELKAAEDERLKSLSLEDEMNCWEYGECPTDETKFVSRWNKIPYSAEREPSTYTEFDGEADREVEDPSSWSKTWYSDSGDDDLPIDVDSKANGGYDI